MFCFVEQALVPQFVHEWCTFGNCFRPMMRSVVDSLGTASQILLVENVHYALAVMAVGDQTGLVAEIWSSKNCLVVILVVAEDLYYELNSWIRRRHKRLTLPWKSSCVVCWRRWWCCATLWKWRSGELVIVLL